MTSRSDFLVVGAGPAGAAAAVEAAAHGLSVSLIDENAAAGGQVYRKPAQTLAEDPDGGGTRLRAELARSGVQHLPGRSVWNVAQGFSVQALGPAGTEEHRADRLMLATGATERVIPLPGWDLPGVIGLAAATIAIKAHRTVPPGPVLVAGAGPLLYAVASGFVGLGARVAAVVDLVAASDWARRAPAMASRPALLAQGAGWMLQLRRAGVPILFGHTVTRIDGQDAVAGAWIAACDSEGGARGAVRRIEVSAVALGHGLMPATEASRLLGLGHSYRHSAGGWVPDLGADGRCAIPGLFLAGDSTGILGAEAAAIGGRLAGLAAARDAGALNAASFDARARTLRKSHAATRRFAAAVSDLIALRPGLLNQTTPNTVVCRCEDVPRADIEAAAARGARTLNQLKSATRCGMGPCQGRLCGEAAAEILMRATGAGRASVGQWTARPPLRPLDVHAMVGSFGYGDIEMPPAAPG